MSSDLASFPIVGIESQAHLNICIHTGSTPVLFWFVLLRNDVNKNKREVFIGPRAIKRCGRRAQKNICLSPTDPYSGMLTTGTGKVPVCMVCACIIVRLLCFWKKVISLYMKHGNVWKENAVMLCTIFCDNYQQRMGSHFHIHYMISHHLVTQRQWAIPEFNQ